MVKRLSQQTLNLQSWVRIPVESFQLNLIFLKLSFFTTTMDQLCEPIEVNRKFIKLLETQIKPKYDQVFHELLTKLKEDIDHTYVSNNKILKKTS